MRKYIYIRLFVFGAFLLAICSSAFGLKLQPELDDWLSGKDSLVAGIECDIPPFSFMDRHGEPDGFDVDIARQIERLLGKRVVFIIAQREEILAAAYRGEIDFLPGENRTSELESRFNFTRKLLSNEYMLYIRKCSKELVSISGLNGLKIGYLDGSPVLKVFEKSHEVDLIGFKSASEGLRQTAEGEIDGYIGSVYICNYAIKLNKLHDELSVNTSITFKYEYSMAVPSNNPELEKILDLAVSKLESEPAFRDIIDKWFSAKGINGSRYNPLAWILIAVIIISFFLILILVRSRERAKLTLLIERQLTERYSKTIEEMSNLRKSFVEAANNAGLGLFILDDIEGREGKFIEVNEGLEDLTGYNREDLLDMTIDKLLSEKDREKIINRYRSRRSGEPQPESYEILGIRADGEIIPAELFVKTVSSPKGLSTIGILRDISRVRALQDKLRRSDQNFRKMLSGLPQGAMVLNSERIIYINNAFRQLIGRTPEEIRAFGIDRIVAPIHRTKIERYIDNLLSGKEASKEIEIEIIGLDNKLILTSSRPRAINYFGEPVVLFVFENLTEENQLKKRLGIESRVDGLGRVAENVILKYNNTLMGILGAISQIRSETPDDSPLMEYVNIVEKDTDRAAILTQKLLAFSRETEEHRGEVLSLNKVVKDALELMPESEGRTIDLHTELKARPDTTFGNLSQVHQAVLNLIVNAVEAMKDGGTLGIATGNLKVDVAFRSRHPEAKHGRYIFIEVSDTGEGIPQKLLDNIFEPFFTTKEFGAGTGLGLSLVYKIARRHKGFVDVESEHGEGSKFTLYFPEEIADSKESSSTTAFPTGDETILVVDDEPHVRTVLKALLSKLGYEVLLACDGFEAVEAVRSRGNDIDLVLLDVVMPGMSGLEVFEAIRAIKPDCRVIVSTGYAQKETVSDLVRQGVESIVQKPYRAGTLSVVIRRVLDEKGEGETR